MPVHEARVSDFKGITFTYRSDKEYLIEYARCQREWYARCKQNRICPNCEVKLSDDAKRVRCDPCSDIINARKSKGIYNKRQFEFVYSGTGNYQSEYKRALRKWCEENGICTRCAKQPSLEGRLRCEGCKGK